MDDFLNGLIYSLNWDGEMTNVILGNHLSWLYALGIVINFLVCLAVFIYVTRDLLKTVKESGGWRGLCFNTHKRLVASKGLLRFWLSVSLNLIFIVWTIVYLLGYRVVNGLTQYHYFTSQGLTRTVAMVTVEETRVGRIGRHYSKVVLSANVSGVHQRMNVSNSTKTMARFYRPLEGKTYPALVEVNENNKIIYIYRIVTK